MLFLLLFLIAVLIAVLIAALLTKAAWVSRTLQSSWVAAQIAVDGGALDDIALEALPPPHTTTSAQMLIALFCCSWLALVSLLQGYHVSGKYTGYV
eukprot:9420430-Pyramimonas_sp.AAC.1